MTPASASASEFNAKGPLFEQLFGNIRLSAKRLNYTRMDSDNAQIPPAGLRLLDCLLDRGPLTVPQLARQWSTSRQNLQIVVNRLLRAELIEPTRNPAHKRSALYKLTPAGEMAAGRVSLQNSTLLNYLAGRFSDGELRTACAVLDRLGGSIREFCSEHPDQKPTEAASSHIPPVPPPFPKPELITEMPVALL